MIIRTIRIPLSNRIGRKIISTTWCLAALVVGLQAAALCGCFQSSVSSRQLEAVSQSFVMQANALGESLNAGETGDILLPATEADELLLLPCYSTKEMLKQVLPHVTERVINQLVDTAGDDRTPAELVWIRDRKIVAIFPARLQGGMNLSPRLWPVRKACEIPVRKESQSANSFLSLEFPE